MNALQSYALSKRYTDDTVIGLGAIKGSNATIESIVHQDGQNIVTFRWVSIDGSTIEHSQMVVLDGSPIYEYIPGTTYHYGDLVIYQSMFYRCINEHVAPADFNPNMWDPIGNPDGAYGLVETFDDLPDRLTAADRKIYFVIDENQFWLWDGSSWNPLCPDTITNDEIDALFV